MSASIFPATGKNIERAAALLKDGRAVAFPTETVYGLGANACSDAAVATIYALKNRPQFNPLICHMLDVEMASRHVVWNETAQLLAEWFWPGPLTLVLPRKQGISLLASAGLDSVAVRSPAHPVARMLIEACGFPLAAPSANRSGHVSPTIARHVADEFAGEVPMILDGGACEVGIESTVVDCTMEGRVRILRPGIITQEEIARIVRIVNKDTGIMSPGMLASHYAPSLPVRLQVTQPRPDEALIAFGGAVPGGAAATINLSVTGNLKEAAANLFAAMREVDRDAFSSIAVMPIPEEGIGVAINDRLRRAATRT